MKNEICSHKNLYIIHNDSLNPCFIFKSNYQIVKQVFDQEFSIYFQYRSQPIRFWFLSHRPTWKSQMNLCICTVLPEPLLITCAKNDHYGALTLICNKILVLIALPNNKGSGNLRQAIANVQTCQSLYCSHTQSLDVDEVSDQNSCL